MPRHGWKFIEGQKNHTQDGCDLVKLIKKGSKLAIDVGCGDGIIAWQVLEQQKAAKIIAVDILSSAIKAAKVNLQNEIINGRAEVFKKSAQSFFKDKKNYDKFDCFIINPPFFVAGSGRSNKSHKDQVARHETKLNLKSWAKGAHNLLRTGGELYCVFPTERLAELCSELSKNNVEPKEIWWLKQDLRKRRFFLRAKRGAKPGVVVHFDLSLKA